MNILIPVSDEIGGIPVAATGDQAFADEVVLWLATLPVVACQVHPGATYHRPKPLRLVVHHVQPLGMGGPDVPSNWVVTCDTGHFNLHRLMGILLHADGGAGQPETRQLTAADHGTVFERSYAQLGYAMWVHSERPGRPVYEFA